MSGRGGTFAAVLATLVAFVALDAALAYVMWGVGFGMKDVQWNPIFPLWLVVGVVAAVPAFRLRREHDTAVKRTAIVGVVLTVPWLILVWFMGIWACGDGGGCHGILGGR
jgi:hypothetical protein